MPSINKKIVASETSLKEIKGVEKKIQQMKAGQE